MRIRRHFTLAAGLLAMVLPALAVTNEEIAKMRQAMPDKPVVQPERPRRMLVFSLCKGFNHSSIPYWAKALDIMAEKTGAFAVEHSTDMSVFTP
ncbi:MAG: ThuA domain-containing protein, partial [Planctomycetes bacterium]|nr:ThuA domain-containing protein [Planctomycetota bacterium]